jgi:lipopolysaccharide transport system ATP-binding protein
MYIRLAFAVAANLSSDILIVDEVLAVGDAEFQRKCLSYMSNVAHAGRTVLFVSHNMGAVRNLCTRAIWLRDGHVYRDGLVEDVVNEYQLDVKNEIPASDGFFHRPSGDVLAGKLTWVKALRIARPDGSPTQLFNYGDDVRIDYYLGGEPAREGCALLWVLQDAWGVNLAWSNSAQLCGYKLKKRQMSGTCIIHNLPLSSGRYYLTVTCGIAGAGEAKDLWRQAVCFDVVDCDPYATHDAMPSSSLGSVILEQSWQDMSLE